MTKIIGAPTLDDAVAALGREVARCEERGEGVLVFCEDRLTLLAERAAIRETGGTFLTEVTTFARYLKGSARTLSKYGSVMALSSIIEENGDRLRCFGVGSAQAVYETLAQLLSSGVTSKMLEESAQKAEGMLGRKLGDLAFLLEAYETFLRENDLLDENGYLSMLPAKIEEKRPPVVIFFGFSSFTRQARDGVRAAILTAQSVTGIFLAGKSRLYTNEAAKEFRLIAEEFGGAETVMEKSSLAGEAAVLSGELYAPEATVKKRAAAGVYCFTAADEREEAAKIAALIKRETAAGRRYRDITVLTGSTDDFPAVEKALSAYEIPYYLDRKRKFSEHPFCAFVLSVLDAAACGGLTDSIDNVAASVYFGDAGEYRNYLARAGGRFAVRREIRADAEPYGVLVAAREKMLAILKLVRAKDTGEGYARAIRTLWELVEGERVTEELKAACEEERAFLDIGKLSAVLDETVRVAPAGKFTARQFYHLLKNGLETFGVSVLPRHADAVFVGDAGESKIYRSPVLFLAGMTDDVPHVVEDTAVITDGEIKKLSALEVEVEPSIAVVNARAREAFALNVCSFSETLYLSCPRRKRGEETALSELFLYVGRTFETRKLPDLFPYDCSAFSPALLTYFSSGDESLLAALREAFSRDVFGHGMPVFPETLRTGVQKAPVPAAASLYFAREISPTLLETYFLCPYKSFAMRALRLDEGESPVTGAADAGTFVHTVLQLTAKRFNEFPDEAACGAAAQAAARELLVSPRFSPLSETAAGSYAGERLVAEATRVAQAAFRQLKGSNFRVREAETELTLPALSIRGIADRVDETANSVRIIDYKTGKIDASAAAYYTGRKLQLQLYLLAASKDKRAAGAFYFPAADDITPGGKSEEKFRMEGFFCNDRETVSDMDITAEGGESLFFRAGGRSAKGMDREEFDDFLSYALLVSEQAEREMREGNIRPSPYHEACSYCKLKGMCGFSGSERRESDIGCGSIVDIVRAQKHKKEDGT